MNSSLVEAKITVTNKFAISSSTHLSVNQRPTLGVLIATAFMANRNIPERFQRTSNILNAGKHDSGIAQSPPPVPPKDEKYNQSQPYVSRLDPGPFSPISTEPLESSKMKKARSLDKPTSNTTQQQESQGSSSNPSNSKRNGSSNLAVRDIC